MKIIIAILLILFSFSNFYAQNVLYREDCTCKIDKDLSNVIIAFGDDDCVVFEFQSQLNRDIYTILVFSRRNKDKLIYQVSYIDGVKEGIELMHIYGEKVIVNYKNGKAFGESYTYYNTGELHYIKKYKNGKLKSKYLEFGKDGALLNVYYLNKEKKIRKVKSHIPTPR